MHGRAGSGASDQAPDAWPSRKRSFRPGPGCMAEQEAELPTRPRMHGRAGSGASDQAPDAWPSRKRSFRPGPGCMAEQEAELPTRPSGLSVREYGTDRADIVLAKRAAGGRTWSDEALLFELKHENSGGKTPLEQLSGEALSQAMEKYTDGVLGKWQPKRTLVLGIGFRGKKLALTYENLSHAGDAE